MYFLEKTENRVQLGLWELQYTLEIQIQVRYFNALNNHYLKNILKLEQFILIKQTKKIQLTKMTIKCAVKYNRIKETMYSKILGKWRES